MTVQTGGWPRGVAFAICTAAVACGGGQSQVDADGSASASETGNTTATTGSADGSSSQGTSGATSSSASATDTAADTTTADASDDGPKFDIGARIDLGPGGCDPMGGDVEFSYIWIANSSEGTISKINTETMVEEGRYIVRADSAGNPSRTSVNLSGDVAVANRAGGVTKVFAREADCADTNGMPGIQTSSGPNDVLPWGIEECVAWFTALSYESNRPVAWAPGTLDLQTCKYEGEKLWTSASDPSVDGPLMIFRLDGDTGATEDEVMIPGIDLGSWGAYGGAVDGDGNFWVNTHGTAAMPTITRVDAVSLQYDTYPTPAGLSPYGFTVDSEGRPWVAGYAGTVSRFDPMTETWDQVAGGQLGFGIQEDALGRMWLAGNYDNAAVAIDAETLQVLESIPLPAGIQKGLSIDFFGNVWIVYQYGDAYRIDPDTGTYDVYSGLNGAYTYSDMTGWGLSNVAFPPG